MIPGQSFVLTPLGWLFTLFCYPCGVLGVILAAYFQFRTDIDAEDSRKVVRRSVDVGAELGGRRALNRTEIKRFCAINLISKQKQIALEEEGELTDSTCLMCLDGPTKRGRYWIEFPQCGHKYHASCVRESLEHDVSRCRVATCRYVVYFPPFAAVVLP